MNPKSTLSSLAHEKRTEDAEKAATKKREALEVAAAAREANNHGQTHREDNSHTAPGTWQGPARHH